MWWNLLIGVVLSVILSFLRPKPEPPKPSTISDFDIPVTKEGTEVPVIYGTIWIDSPQIVWYGDFKTAAIKTKSGKK